MKILKFFYNLFFGKDEHVHGFDIYDVMNTKIDPVCSCGKTLSELSKK